MATWATENCFFEILCGSMPRVSAAQTMADRVAFIASRHHWLLLLNDYLCFITGPELSVDKSGIQIVNSLGDSDCNGELRSEHCFILWIQKYINNIFYL